MNNRNLTIIFVVLLAAFAASKIFKGNQDTSFEKVMIHVDTSLVDKIIVHPKGEEPEYSIIKSDQGWTVSKTGVSTRANASTVNSMLGTLSNIEIQRLVARSKDSWADYEVDEDRGVRIEVYHGSKKLEDFVVGRFNFNQQTRSATSYLRKTADNDIFALDGFLSMTLNQGFDGVRDKTILNLQKELINQVDIRSSVGTESLNNTQGLWLKRTGERIDSTQMDQYLNGITRLNGTTVNDQANAKNLTEVATLRISDGAIHDISIYANGADYLIHSTANEGVYFNSDSSSVYKKLLVDLNSILWKENSLDLE